MEVNKQLHDQILGIIENQLKQNDPPETKQTFERLIKSGISLPDAKRYIGQCIAVELFNIMKHGEAFNERRFIRNLLRLPEDPFE
jgi:hypothetical protein